MRSLSIGLSVFSLLLMSSSHAQRVYKWSDSKGVHYSDRAPPEGAASEEVRQIKVRLRSLRERVPGRGTRQNATGSVRLDTSSSSSNSINATASAIPSTTIASTLSIESGTSSIPVARDVPNQGSEPVDQGAATVPTPIEVSSTAGVQSLETPQSEPAWASVQGDLKNTGFSDKYGPQSKRVKWGFRIDGWAQSPAIGADGTIYFGDGSGVFHALGPDGNEKWSLELASKEWPEGWEQWMVDDIVADGGYFVPHPVGSAAIGGDGTIYVATSFHPYYARDDPSAQSWYQENKHQLGLYAVSQDGNLLWMFNTNQDIRSAPNIGTDGTIYFATTDTLYALRPDKTVKWTLALVPDDPSGGSNPAIGDDGTIYIVDSALRAITPDGILKWSYKNPEYGPIAVTYAHPTIGADGTIYFATQNYFYAVASSGNLKWRTEVGWTESSPAIGPDGTLYVVSNEIPVVKGQIPLAGFDPVPPALRALDPVDGSQKWEFPVQVGSDVSPAVGSDGTVYFGTDSGYYYAIGPDGREKWRIDIGRTTIPGYGEVRAEADGAPAIGPDGTLYFGHSGSAYPKLEVGYFTFYAIGD